MLAPVRTFEGGAHSFHKKQKERSRRSLTRHRQGSALHLRSVLLTAAQPLVQRPVMN